MTRLRTIIGVAGVARRSAWHAVLLGLPPAVCAHHHVGQLRDSDRSRAAGCIAGCIAAVLARVRRGPASAAVERTEHATGMPLQYVGVDLRRLHILVPQQLLHGADIVAVFQ